MKKRKHPSSQIKGRANLAGGPGVWNRSRRGILCSKPMPTCLFTGTTLTPNTLREHTIPRSVGGRIRSREVSSDSFNGRAGSYVDPFLYEPYSEVMTTLGPVLTAEHRGGTVTVEVPG